MPERWNDQAIDGLAGRLSDVEDELVPLREVPAVVAQHERRLDRMREDQLIAGQEEIRRVEAVRRDLRDLNRKIDRRFDTVDEDHQAAQQIAKVAARRANGINWPSLLATLIAVAAGIGVPVGLALALQ